MTEPAPVSCMGYVDHVADLLRERGFTVAETADTTDEWRGGRIGIERGNDEVCLGWSEKHDWYIGDVVSGRIGFVYWLRGPWGPDPDEVAEYAKKWLDGDRDGWECVLNRYLYSREPDPDAEDFDAELAAQIDTELRKWLS